MVSTWKPTWYDNLPGLSQNHPARTGLEPELSGLRHAVRPLVVHVDDDPDMLALVRFVLEVQGGYRMQSFTQGTDALSYCHERPPDVLITDVARPGMDGPTLCEHLRADSCLRDLSIIMFSGWTSDRAIAERYNCVCLSKPCSWQDILVTVDMVVQANGLNLPPRTALI